MSDDKQEDFTFSESADGKIANLGANATDEEGTNLFPQVGKKMTVQIIEWEMGFADPKTGKSKPIIQLKTDNGELYQRVLGVNMRKKIASLGIKKPDELIGQFITFEKYDTKSSRANMRWGLRIISISEKKTLE